MKRIHTHLTNKVRWYAKWHQHPMHGACHFLGFLALAVVVTSLLLGSIGEYAQSAANTEPTAKTLPKAELGQLTHQLVQELKRYETAPLVEKQERLNSLVQIVQKRQEALKARISAKDRSVEAQFLPEGFRKRLPAEVQGLLEKEVSWQGNLEVYFVDTVEEKNSYVEYVFEGPDKKRYNVAFGTETPRGLKNGLVVSINGTAVGDQLYAPTNTTQNVKVVSGSEQSAPVTGSRTLLVIPVAFVSNPTQNKTVADIDGRVFSYSWSAANLIREGSYGAVTLTGTVTPWVTINSPTDTCGYNTWGSLADQAASALGYTPSSYNHVMYYLNGVSTSVCNWGGKGSMPGRNTWINSAYAATGTESHELGHNFGAHHAGFANCGGTSISTSCTVDQYGDQYAVMGRWSNNQFHALHRYQLGWYPTSVMQNVSGSGTYTVYGDYGSSTLGPKILKIAKLDTGEYYYISYRQAQGFNAGISAGNTRGATVQVWTGTPGSVITKLLTMVPGTNYTEEALSDGATFTDVANGLSFTQLSHTDSTVTVSVTMSGPPCVRANPTVTISPASATGPAGASLNYTLTVKNNNSSVCPTAVYNIAKSVPAGWTANSLTNLSLGNGQSASVTLSVASPSGQADGSYGFSASATDSSDASKAASANATYIVYTPPADGVIPYVNITSPLSGTKVGTNATVSGTASDNVGVVKMEVYIDGALKATSATGSVSYRWNTKKVAAGTHTITLKAYDAAGNVGQAVISVYK